VQKKPFFGSKFGANAQIGVCIQCLARPLGARGYDHVITSEIDRILRRQFKCFFQDLRAGCALDATLRRHSSPMAGFWVQQTGTEL